MFGVFIGRMCPIHLGHEAVIRMMLEKCGIKKSLIIIGSSNAPLSWRQTFSYVERRAFIKKIFPEIKVVGLPDYFQDEIWLTALDDLLVVAGFDLKKTVFFGGSAEDLRWFVRKGRKIKIIDRSLGKESPKISATEVRKALLYHCDLKGLVNDIIIQDVKAVFWKNWKKFKSIRKEKYNESITCLRNPKQGF